MKKQNKGITLIALVVTIIVLLILAAVTISTLTGDNGILTKAGNAKTETNNAEKEEQLNLAIMGSYGEDGSLNLDDLKNNLREQGISYENSDDFPLIVTINGEEIKILEDGTISKATTGSWKQEGDTITNTQTNQTIKVGDYVNYDPTLGANTSDLTYSSPASKTGADSDQDFDAQTYNDAGYGWRVLGVANGKIRLISEEFVGAGRYEDSDRTYYTLKGQNGYINGIDELNKISAIFGHGKGAESATSITVEDINSITSYNPETAKYEEGYFWEYGNKVTYTRGEGSALSSSATNGKTWSGTESTFNYYDKATKTFKSLTSGGIEITCTSYTYGPATLRDGFTQPTQGVDENGTYNEVYQMLFGKYTMTSENGYYRSFTGTGTVPQYWLASDYAGTALNHGYWGLRSVGNGGVSNSSLYESSGNGESSSYGVRPVVSLKSDISLKWNDTAQEWNIQ